MSMNRDRPVVHRSKQPPPPRSFELGQKLQQALLFHRQGQLVQAERLYRQILKRTPNHFDALQLLGALELQRKNHDAAVRLIHQALKLNPQSATAPFNVGIAWRQLERYEEALDSFDRALAINPDYAEALNNRGNVLYGLKRPEDALESFGRALILKPDYPEALNNRGNVSYERRHDFGPISSPWLDRCIRSTIVAQSSRSKSMLCIAPTS
jgi:tetratricopeptide (TPR) repeat protein